MKKNDSSYLAYSLACAPVPHTIERVPGIQSRLWAACQRCRPELETPHRSAGHLDLRGRRSHKRLRVSKMSFLSSLFRTFCLSLFSNYRTMLRIWSLIQTIQTVSKRPSCIAGAYLLWFNFANLISHNCICARSRNNNAEHIRVIPSILFEQLRAELGNQSLTQTRKLHSVRIKRRW